jgi:hypothetical protein
MINLDNPMERIWKDKIAVSSLRPNRLPQHINEGDAKVVRVIESNLNNVAITKKPRFRFSNPDPDYHIVASIDSSNLLFVSRFGVQEIGRVSFPVGWYGDQVDDEDEEEVDEGECSINGPFMRA